MKGLICHGIPILAGFSVIYVFTTLILKRKKSKMFLAWIPILWPVAVVVVEVVLRLVYQEGYSHSSHRGPFYFLIRNVLAGLVAAPLAERMAMKNYKIPKDNKS